MILTILIYMVLIIFCSISIYNFYTAPILLQNKIKHDNNYLVSVLIPVRNEEDNIEECLQSISQQSYSNLEILVLDDQSTDQTSEIVLSHAQKENPLKFIRGEELPAGWTGKNWACSQLYKESKGDYFLFIDADVRLSETAISSALKEIEGNKVGMLSVFPTQIIKSPGEWFIVPLMNWFLLTLLPLNFIYKIKSKKFTAANGQFMIWDRRSYERIGGHRSVYNQIVEDMELAKKAKEHNIPIITLLGGKLVKCRMYSNFFSAFNGFTKNFYPGFKLNSFFFLIFILFLTIVFLIPYLDPVKYYLLFLVIFVNRITISILSRQNFLVNILIHPFQIFLMLLIALSSVILFRTGKITWKGRKL